MLQDYLRRIGKYDSIVDMLDVGERLVSRLLESGCIKPGTTVLDYGAGLGRIAIPLSRFCDVRVYEPHEASLRHLTRNGLSDEFAEEHDVALCLHVLQHLSLVDAREVLTQLSGLADRLLFTYPTYEQVARCTGITSDQFIPALEMVTDPDCSASGILPVAAFGVLMDGTGWDVMTCREVIGIDGTGKMLMWEISGLG